MPEIQNPVIKFHYTEEIIDITQNNETQEKEVATIHCRLKDGNETLSLSKVRLHQGDVPNRIVGRTYAFKKAVSKINNKEIRTQLWGEFRTKMKQIA